jgi:hypothetical protein
VPESRGADDLIKGDISHVLLGGLDTGLKLQAQSLVEEVSSG